MDHLIEKLLIRSYLTKKTTNNIFQNISFNLNMMFWVKMIKNYYFSKNFL